MRHTRKKRKQKGGSAKTVVIVETRKPKALTMVLQSVFENLGKEWNLLFFHGSKNKEWIQKIIDTHFAENKSRITLEPIPGNPANMTVDDYNRLMVDPNGIIPKIPTEIFLVIQTDSILCKGKGHLLNDFMKYDYVGAPWRNNTDSKFVGNGGLSLRRKSKMLDVINRCKHNGHQEDGFLSAGCEGVVVSKPTATNAKRFSIEQIYSPESFGIHKAWNYLPEHSADLSAQCEKFGSLRNIQSEYNA
jgi:hypothetical protein